MNTLALLMLLAGADPVQVPVAGRPVDFSGAVGGPFEVSYVFGEKKPEVAKPYTFHVTLKGTGDLSHVKPFSFAGLSNHFVVDGVEAIRLADDLLVFDYAVRFRHHSDIVLPRLRFVYYNPTVRNYQTTYADARPIEIEYPWSPLDSPELNQWAQRLLDDSYSQSRDRVWNPIRVLANNLGLSIPDLPNGDQRFLSIVWAVPPLLSAAGLLVFRRRTSVQQSTATQAALNQLKVTGGDLSDHIRCTLLKFFGDECRLPEAVHTASEIEKLTGPSRLVEVLKECDHRRFGIAQIDQCDLLLEARHALTTWKIPQ